MGTLRDAASGEPLSTTVRRARNVFDRLIGALRERTLAPTDGIWFEPCSALHTFGMRAAVDILLLDGAGTVITVRADVRPNRTIVAHPRARAAIEMGAGFLARTRVGPGARLAFEELPRERIGRTVLAADDGATLVEYALIVALLTLAIVAGVSGAGAIMQQSFANISSAVGGA